MRKIIHISDSKTEVIAHLEKQLNKSAYIVQLIEKDMENRPMTKEEMIKLIKEYFGEGNIQDNDLLDSINDCLSF